jgi:hypothetical protein
MIPVQPLFGVIYIAYLIKTVVLPGTKKNVTKVIKVLSLTTWVLGPRVTQSVMLA